MEENATESDAEMQSADKSDIWETWRDIIS